MFSRCLNCDKQFRESDSLHRCDAHDLQNFPELLRQLHPAFGNGDSK